MTKGKSQFLGSVSAYYGFEVLQWLAGVLSLSLLTPYMVCGFERWRVSQSEIDGHRLVFTGKIWQAYAIYGFWVLITLIFGSISNLVLYFFGLLLPKQLAFWAVNGLILLINTFFLQTQYRHWVRRKVEFEGGFAPSSIQSKFSETLRTSVVAFLITFFSLKLASPHAHQLKMEHYSFSTKISGRNLKFLGSRKALYKLWWPNLALSIVTFGLYLPILHYLVYKWRIEGLSLAA